MLASVKFRIQVLILNYDENCNNKKACCYKVHRPHRKNIHPSEVNQDTLVSMNCEASLNSAVLQPCALWRGTMRYRELKLLSHTLQQPIRLEQTCGAVQPIPRVNWQPAVPRQGIVWKNMWSSHLLVQGGFLPHWFFQWLWACVEVQHPYWLAAVE